MAILAASSWAMTLQGISRNGNGAPFELKSPNLVRMIHAGMLRGAPVGEKVRRSTLVWGVLSLLAGAPALAEVRPLTLDERVVAQTAIEEVYWRHRIWPRGNPAPKPALAAVLPQAAIRLKVLDYLKKSRALEEVWQRPLTGEQLQAELDRMSRSTRDPEMLRQLYEALDGDAYVIAETLARPTLVERLIRNAYAYDDRFHGAVERRARESLAGARDAAGMRALGGDYVEATYRLRDAAGVGPDVEREGRVVALTAEEWKDFDGRLAPAGRPGALEEDADRFFAAALLSRAQGEATVATVSWAKRPFEAWWSEQAPRMGLAAGSDRASFGLRMPAGGGCVDDTWQLRFYAPGPRYRHAAIWTGSEMIVWGGRTGSGANTASGGRYHPATDTWTSTSNGPGVPAGRSAPTTVWTGTEMIVWGGSVGGNTNANTGGRYDPANDSWTPTSTGTDVPQARDAHTAVWTGDEMIVWGGDGGANTGGRYHPGSDSWIPTAIGAGLPLGRHTAVWTGDEMIVWAGTGGRYDPVNDSWIATSLGTGVPAERSDHTAVWTGSEMIIWGGDGGANTGARYDTADDSWTATSRTAGVPAGRVDHTAVWTGSEMIVWGGQDGSEDTIPRVTGGRYHPGTDSWIPTSVGSGMPAEREDHTAVWTGAEMIVWGGVASPYFDYLQTGGRYDPGTDSWAPTSTGMGVPSRRILHTAVWSGTEMIVWGGYDQSDDVTNTGGRYDPADDSWVPTSTGTNVPEGRDDHTAVWSGTEMIVWGGGSNTGGRYDPVSDSWVPTSTGTDVPEARSFHTAVWSGTEMIVWGGYGGPYLSTGGRYDPASDSWSPTSTGTDVPQARHHHAAVWSGTEMIVWGGIDPSLLNTGGRYDPAADSWRTTSTGPGVPSQRRSPKAVWSGSEMIVWGGSPHTTEVGLYCSLGCGGEDSDGDGLGDPCDTDDGLIYLTLDGDDVFWDAEAGFVTWNAYKGDLQALLTLGLYTQEPGSNDLADRQCDLASRSVSDPDPPDPGATAIFLVTGVDGAGVESALGSDSAGNPRPNDHPCP